MINKRVQLTVVRERSIDVVRAMHDAISMVDRDKTPITTTHLFHVNHYTHPPCSQ